MKLRVDIDGQSCTLELQRANGILSFSLHGAIEESGDAAVDEIMPGVFSVLLGTLSFTVHVTPAGDDLEVWTNGQRHVVSVADARDRPGKAARTVTAGPLEIRAQMPGKVIKLLVEQGAQVHAGQGLIVVEAMKMQNEMKAPKDGVVSKIHAVEGATVAAGDKLMVVE